MSRCARWEMPRSSSRAPGQVPVFPAGPFEQADAAVAAHEHHVQHGDGEAGVSQGPLGQVAHHVALMPQLFRGFAEDPDLAPLGPNQPQDHLEQGAFAGAVGSQDAHVPAGLDGQVDILEDGGPVEVNPYLFEL